MSGLTKDELREVLKEVLIEKDRVDYAICQRDRDFIHMEMRRKQRNRERWEQFQKSLIGGAAMGLIALLGWLGTLVIAWFRHGNNPT